MNAEALPSPGRKSLRDRAGSWGERIVVDGDSGTKPARRVAEAARRVAEAAIDVPDFPLPGIVFKDLTPLFADGPAFAATIDDIVGHYGHGSFDVVAGIEARGFTVLLELGLLDGRKRLHPRPVHALLRV